MIHYLRHEEIDKRAWDQRLLADPQPQWYGQSATLDAACPGWDALVEERTGLQLALPWRRKFGIVYAYQPFLIQQLGPYGAHRSPTDVVRFLAALPARFRYADIYLCDGDRADAPAHTVLAPCTDLLLPLAGNADTLRQGYSENHQRNLRKAASAQAGMDERVPVEELLAFFTGSEQFKRWRIDPRQVATMERSLRTGLERGEGMCWGVREGGRLVAGAYFVKWQHRLIFLKGLADGRGRELRAMHALLDHCIAAHAGQGLVLDMAGSNDADLARFYAGFGARPAIYLRAVVNKLPTLLRRTKT